MTWKIDSTLRCPEDVCACKISSICFILFIEEENFSYMTEHMKIILITVFPYNPLRERGGILWNIYLKEIEFQIFSIPWTKNMWMMKNLAWFIFGGISLFTLFSFPYGNENDMVDPAFSVVSCKALIGSCLLFWYLGCYLPSCSLCTQQVLF